MIQARSSSTRERVLEAATLLVIELGHENVSMKEMVDSSGVSNGSIFHHFGSKDGVLQEVFVRERRAYLGNVRDQIIDCEGDPCDALGAGAKAAIDFIACSPQRHFRVISQFSFSEWLIQNQELWDYLAREIEQPVIEWALPHFAEGRLPILPPAAIQSLMLAPAELMFHQWREGRIGGELANYGPVVAEFVAAGLKHLRNTGTMIVG